MIRQLQNGRSSDEGMSVVMVVISFTVLFAVVLTTSVYVIRSLRPTAAFTDSEKALSAAESGIADYLARAGANPGYWQTTDCDNAALQAPTTDSTCGWDRTTAVGWAPVDAGDEAETAPAYHYELLGWDEQNGTEATALSLRVTGRSGDQYRTVEVSATRTSTEQYAGYQNHWVLPLTACVDADGARLYQRTPEVYRGSKTLQCLRTANAMSQYFGWANDAGNRSGEDTWQLNAWVNPVGGDFFSNDIGFLNPGPSLSGTAEGSPLSGFYQVNGTLTVVNPWCGSNGLVQSWQAGTAFSADCGQLPTNTSSGLPKSQVATTEQPELSGAKTLPYDTTALAEAPGCHYYGPTRIVMESDGTMRVWSKQSAYPELSVAVASRSGTLPTCGTGVELSSDAGAHVVVPAGMVVYVDDLPADVVSTHGVVNERLEAGELGGDATYGFLPTGQTLASVLTDETIQYTAIKLDTSTYASSRYRTKGNLWIEGEYRGDVTVGSVGAVLITGDLIAAGGTGIDSADQLGVVANEVTVVDQRLSRYDRVIKHGDETRVSTMGRTAYYLYTDGVDPASGAKGDWPHDYDGNGDQLRIDAAIQVLTNGFSYQDGGVCAQSVPWNSYDSTDGWQAPPDTVDPSIPQVPFYFTFPGVTYGLRENGSYWASVTEPTDGSATLDVALNGSLAQNYLGTTGVRTEYGHTMGYAGITLVTWAAGTCGMELTVDYDDRLRTASPPYLLRFTDVGWERGESSEVSTPDSLRS